MACATKLDVFQSTEMHQATFFFGMSPGTAFTQTSGVQSLNVLRHTKMFFLSQDCPRELLFPPSHAAGGLAHLYKSEDLPYQHVSSTLFRKIYKPLNNNNTYVVYIKYTHAHPQDIYCNLDCRSRSAGKVNC